MPMGAEYELITIMKASSRCMRYVCIRVLKTLYRQTISCNTCSDRAVVQSHQIPFTVFLTASKAFESLKVTSDVLHLRPLLARKRLLPAISVKFPLQLRLLNLLNLLNLQRLLPHLTHQPLRTAAPQNLPRKQEQFDFETKIKNLLLPPLVFLLKASPTHPLNRRHEKGSP